jgi:hypothetical protein
MQDQKHEEIVAFLTEGSVPSRLPVGSAKRWNWTYETKKKYTMVSQTLSTATIHRLAITKSIKNFLGIIIFD